MISQESISIDFMKLLLILIFFSSSTFAKEFSECMDGAIEAAIAAKVKSQAFSELNQGCSSMNYSAFQEIAEERENKLRFKNKTVLVMEVKKKIDLNFISSLNDEVQGEGDEVAACSYINLKTNVWIREAYSEKYPALKDCPEAVDAYKKSLSLSSIQTVPLNELCEAVEKAEGVLKKSVEVCKSRTAPVVEHKPEVFRPAVFSFPGSGGGHAARASEQ
jgi:hypothetical protein